MTDLGALARLLIVVGLAIALLGGAILLAGRVPGLGWFGRLPGDIRFERGSTTVFVPIVSSIVVSIVLTIVLNLLLRR